MSEKTEIKDTELEAVTGAGEYTEFTDSDDYEHPKTYEEAYKYSKKEFSADAAPSAADIISELKS